MTHRSAKVVTAYRGSVKKPNELISGCEVFRENNVLLTLAQVANKSAPKAQPPPTESEKSS
jgi:hypothetical protein